MNHYIITLYLLFKIIKLWVEPCLKRLSCQLWIKILHLMIAFNTIWTLSDLRHTNSTKIFSQSSNYNSNRETKKYRQRTICILGKCKMVFDMVWESLLLKIRYMKGILVCIIKWVKVMLYFLMVRFIMEILQMIDLKGTES